METTLELAEVSDKNKSITTPAKKERIWYFDNCKFVLIVLVVLAHAISPLRSKYKAIYNIWYIINMFHMPALIFISGYFSKSYIKNKQPNIQKPFTYLLLYIVSQIAVSLFEIYVLKLDIKGSIIFARSSLWYLQGLFLYYIILPYVVNINKKVVVICSFLFGILIGYDQRAGTLLNVMRGFVHFPIFMLGYYLNENFFNFIKKKKVKIPLIIASLILILIICIVRIIPDNIIVCSYNYYDVKGMQLPIYLAWVYRIGFYFTSIIFGLTFFAIMPKKKNIFSVLGARTLQVYILHRFLYLAETQYNWAEYFDSPKRAVALIILTIIIAIVLSQKIFTYPFTLIQKIKINKLLEKDRRAC